MATLAIAVPCAPSRGVRRSTTPTRTAPPAANRSVREVARKTATDAPSPEGSPAVTRHSRPTPRVGMAEAGNSQCPGKGSRSLPCAEPRSAWGTIRRIEQRSRSVAFDVDRMGADDYGRRRSAPCQRGRACTAITEAADDRRRATRCSIRSPTTPPEGVVRSRSALGTPAHLLGCTAAEDRRGEVSSINRDGVNDQARRCQVSADPDSSRISRARTRKKWAPWGSNPQPAD